MAGTLPPKLRALLDRLREQAALEGDLLTLLRDWLDHSHGGSIRHPSLPPPTSNRDAHDLAFRATHCQECEDILERTLALTPRLEAHGADVRMQIDQVEAEATDVMKKAHPELFKPEAP